MNNLAYRINSWHNPNNKASLSFGLWQTYSVSWSCSSRWEKSQELASRGKIIMKLLYIQEKQTCMAFDLCCGLEHRSKCHRADSLTLSNCYTFLQWKNDFFLLLFRSQICTIMILINLVWDSPALVEPSTQPQTNNADSVMWLQAGVEGVSRDFELKMCMSTRSPWYLHGAWCTKGDTW